MPEAGGRERGGGDPRTEEPRCGWALRAGVVVALAAFLAVAASPARVFALRCVKEGDPAPDFTLKDLDGVTHTLSAHKGKVVVLCFFHSEQDKSVKALNDLAKVYSLLKDRNLAVLGIADPAEDKVESIRTLREKLRLSFPVLLDVEKKVYTSYGLLAFPTTALVDKEGKLGYEYTSHGSDFDQTVLEKARLFLGLVGGEESPPGTAKREVPSPPAEVREADRDLQMAKALMQKGLPEKAMPLLAEAIRKDPALTEARLLAGEVLLSEGKAAEARVHFEAVLDRKPDSHEARLGLGSALLAQGDLERAEAELIRASTLVSNPGLAFYRLGQVYEKKGQTQKALESYRKAYEEQARHGAGITPPEI